MPASRFSSNLHVRSTFFVKKYEANPICRLILAVCLIAQRNAALTLVSFAAWTASSSVSNE
jgi:hypothetical protein